MGKQPAVLVIARHGARLDQADREWHATANEPWNPPLSYGGWVQSQSLGARIASELQYLDNPINTDGQLKENTPANPRPRKRRKIIIHSSPYLRCVQTSIAIAAGLRQPQDVPRVRANPTPFQRSSLSRPPMMVGDDASQPNDDSLAALARSATRFDNEELTCLRLDAWLGEWLSSGYFEKSSHPPPSAELVQRAKQVLKKPSEEIKGADIANTLQEFDEFDWTTKPPEIKDPKAMPTHEKTGLRAMAAKGYSMPRRTRTQSVNVNQNANQNVNGNTPASTGEPSGRRPRSTTYSPPVPTYSLAPKDSIPIGFVAHARDACVDTDFDWDSEQPPLEWGDGGQYEEEWSTMHRRFRNGLQSMLSFYEQLSDADVDAEPETDADDDSDEDAVLVLVTHQAGCNALIRLVTGAPALHDVGTASLTLAVRKPGLSRKDSNKESPSPTRRRGSLDLGISYDFDMKIIASSEHLRGGSNPLGLNSPRLAMSPAFASRRMVGPDSADGFSIGDPLTWRSSSQSTVPRMSNSMRGHAHSNSMSNDSLSGSGLWSAREARSSSMSSDTSVDPRSPPTSSPKASNPKVSSSVILEDDEVVEDWEKQSYRESNSHIIASPISIDDQTTWQLPSNFAAKKMPVRSGSTRLSGNASTGTGLWGSPVANPGGVKEGTPHSRSSFGMTDNVAPMWGARSSGQRNSWQNPKPSFTATKEEEKPKVDDQGIVMGKTTD